MKNIENTEFNAIMIKILNLKKSPSISMGLVRGWASGDTPTHRAFHCQPNLNQSALFNAISIN